MSYTCERPISMVVAEPSTQPNQDIEELEDALAKMKQERDLWEEQFRFLPSSRSTRYLIGLHLCIRQADLYDTRTNHQRRMDHLEQENHDLKEEVARLTALMESFIVFRVNRLQLLRKGLSSQRLSQRQCHLFLPAN
ncbi:hypothetical protein KIW84_012781 [Lathyrus oleraceus]|uniref:Uncharacterized protein n=1 Tax=Pisum sativum TaxID=3888 RepID=A0A9D5BIL5_PEA|nr:hypothetical protein KIW84_012781 [Pisum sativum]